MISRLKHQNDMEEIHRMLEWIEDRFPPRYRNKRQARHNARMSMLPSGRRPTALSRQLDAGQYLPPGLASSRSGEQ